jgi:hypothetical protein
MAFLFAVVCTSENEIPIPPVGGDGDDPGKVTLQIVFPKMDDGTLGTRALTPAEENRIDSLDVFVFKNNSSSHSVNDTWLYRVSVPRDSIHLHSNDTTYRVTVTLETRPVTGQRLICVANIPKGLNLSLTEEVSTVQDLVEQLKFAGAPWHEAPTSASYGLPMWGQMNTTLTFSTDPGGGLVGGIPVISMIRAMAKIEVGVDVRGTGDPALGFGYVFELDSVFVCQVSDSGYIAPHADFIDKTAVSITNPVDKSKRISMARYKFAADPSGSRKMANTIYVPETDSLITSPLIAPPYLVIKAKYYDGTPYNEYYYRIDFVSDNKYRPLLRNHNYLVNILNIRMPGYRTLGEAMNAPPASTNSAVAIGTGGGLEVSPEIMDVVVYKNEYMLGVNTSEVMFDWTGEWLGKTSTEAHVEFRLMLYTDCENGWEAAVSSGSSWLSFEGAHQGGKTPPAAVGLGIKAAANTTGEERRGEITLTAGLLTKTITVRQSGGANSVIVKSNQQPLRIPLKFAEKARAALGLPAVSGTVAVVGWNSGTNITTLEPLTISGDEILTAGNLDAVGDQWGNALVILTAGADTVWSWHVWVVNDEDINASYHSMNTRSVFMDRLLGGPRGAFSQPGQPYYQWGRKDPFLPGQYAVSAAANTGMIAQGVRNPRTFYASSAPNYNWTGGAFNNNLWNNADTGEKTYSDPCPSGWRVAHYQPPAVTPWQNETPANILNYRNTGYISTAGTWTSSAEGFIWTGIPYGSMSYYANIGTAGVVLPLENEFRGKGYAVRCVKDISRKY